MKYIVDNLASQTITGDLTVGGDFSVNDGTHSMRTYRALLTQTGVITGTYLEVFSNALIIGETYTINSYSSGDDFTNVASVVSGTINETGCQFIATGEIPINWSNGSELQSSGNLVVQVLENTLGFNIIWSTDVGPGFYVGYKTPLGFLFNDFPRANTSVQISQSYIMQQIGPPPGPITQFAGPGSAGSKDDCLVVFNFDYDSYSGIDYWLYYTPIEIRMKQNIETSPILINGTVESSFSFGNVAIDLFNNGNYVDSVYCDDTSTVNDISELVTLLNNDVKTSLLGTFADDGSGGVTLTMTTSRKKQLSPTGTLTIEIFAD